MFMCYGHCTCTCMYVQWTCSVGKCDKRIGLASFWWSCTCRCTMNMNQTNWREMSCCFIWNSQKAFSFLTSRLWFDELLGIWQSCTNSPRWEEVCSRNFNEGSYYYIKLNLTLISQAVLVSDLQSQGRSPKKLKEKKTVWLRQFLDTEKIYLWLR